MTNKQQKQAEKTADKTTEQPKVIELCEKCDCEECQCDIVAE